MKENGSQHNGEVNGRPDLKKFKMGILPPEVAAKTVEPADGGDVFVSGGRVLRGPEAAPYLRRPNSR